MTLFYLYCSSQVTSQLRWTHSVLVLFDLIFTDLVHYTVGALSKEVSRDALWKIWTTFNFLYAFGDSANYKEASYTNQRLLYSLLPQQYCLLITPLDRQCSTVTTYLQANDNITVKWVFPHFVPLPVLGIYKLRHQYQKHISRLKN